MLHRIDRAGVFGQLFRFAEARLPVRVVTFPSDGDQRFNPGFEADIDVMLADVAFPGTRFDPGFRLAMAASWSSRRAISAGTERPSGNSLQSADSARASSYARNGAKANFTGLRGKSDRLLGRGGKEPLPSLPLLNLTTTEAAV
jgi:hypothetical protein